MSNLNLIYVELIELRVESGQGWVLTIKKAKGKIHQYAFFTVDFMVLTTDVDSGHFKFQE